MANLTGAIADEFPEHSAEIVRDGEELRCYDLAAAKIFMGWKLDNEYLSGQVTNLEDRAVLLYQEIEALENISSEKDEIIQHLRDDRDRLFEKWKTDNKRLHEAENDVDLLPWFIAAGASALAVGFGTYAFVK